MNGYGFSLYIVARAIQEDRLAKAGHKRRARTPEAEEPRFEASGRLLGWPEQQVPGQPVRYSKAS